MGLLDKVEGTKEDKPKPKAVAKAKPVAKAVPKAKAKAVAKASPKKAVAKKASPKEAKVKKPRSRDINPDKIRPTGLPEGFELAGKMPRYIGWLINFGWNFGVLIGTLSIFIFGDPDLTVGFVVAAVMILLNWVVLPIWLGRNVGEFVSRTKYINSSGNKPFPIHALLNNSLGFLFLIGFILIGTNISRGGDMVMVGLGSVFMLLWIVNFFFKKNSDYSQGLFDMAFNAYLVKHVSTGEETGWAARFEGLGDFGDKWAEKQEQRKEKALKKAEEKAKQEESNEEESVDDAPEETSDETEDKE